MLNNNLSALMSMVNMTIPNEIKKEILEYNQDRLGHSLSNFENYVIEQPLKTLINLLNLDSGEIVDLDIFALNARREVINSKQMIIEIHPSAVNNKGISSVEEVYSGSLSKINILSPTGFFNDIHTTNVTLIGKNKMIVNSAYDLRGTPGELIMRVRLGFDLFLNAINSMYMNDLVSGILLFIKKSIFNDLGIYLLNKGLTNGISVGRVQEIIDSYDISDVELMETVNKISNTLYTYNNSSSINTHINMITPIIK